MISFMNTFFVASILICCLLVLMLIYNFRQRLNTLETNYKLTLDMLNNVVQKMAMIENGVSGGYETQELNIPYMEMNQEHHPQIQGEESEGEESEGEDMPIDESKTDVGREEQEDMEDDNTISTEDGKEMALTLESDGDLNYEKMNLTQLRALVKTRGLASSVSKMKKADALALLTA